MKRKKIIKRFWAALLTAALCVCLVQTPGVYAAIGGREGSAEEEVTGSVEDTTSTAETEETSSEQGSAAEAEITGTVADAANTADGAETSTSTEVSAASAASEADGTADASETEGASGGESLQSSGGEASAASEENGDSQVTVNGGKVRTLTSSGSDISMKVTLGGEELTGDSASVTGWEYTESKEMLVTITKEAGEACAVQIDLPMQVYATTYTSAEDSGISDLEFEDLADQTDFEDLSVYTNRSYNTAVGYYKTYRDGGENGSSPSGTWTYVIEESATVCTISMTLKYDASLWSNVKETEVLTDADDGSVVTIAAYEGSTVSSSDTPIEKVSLTRITSGTTTMSYRNTLMYYKYGTSSSSVGFSSALAYLDQDEGVVVQAFIDQWKENTTYLYYTDVTLELTFPSYTKSDGTTYYLTLDTDGNFKNYKNQIIYFNQSGNYTISEDKSTLTKTVSDSMIMPSSGASSAYLSMIPLCLPTEFEGDKETNSGLYEFTGGHLKLTGTTANGDTVTIYDQDIGVDGAITYKSDKYQGEEAVTALKADKSVTAGLPEDAVTLLGGVRIANEGAGDSEAKTITMSFDGKLLVTDVNLLADTESSTIAVTYTLKDKDENKVTLSGDSEWTINVTNSYYGTSTSGSGLCLNLNTTMLGSEQENYYFDTVSYTIKSIAAQTSMYTLSGFASKSSPGNYFGYLADGASDGDKLGTVITIDSADSSNIKQVEVTSTTTVTDEDTSGYGIQDVSMTDAVESGNQIELSGTIFVRGDYTNGNNTVLRDIHLGVILPDGVSVGTASLTSADQEEVECSLETCDEVDVGDGYTLYLITPKATSFYIGYYSIGLEESDNGAELDFSLTLATTEGMASTTLNSYDMLYVWGGDGQTNTPGGTYLAYQREDSYDLNNNNDNTDQIGGMSSASAVTCRITTTGGAMDDEETASAGGTFTFGETTYQTITSGTDTTTYTLSFNNKKSGTAKGFVYYIPVPKKSDASTDFVSKAGFDFTLADSSAITVTSTEITDLEYTVSVATETSLSTYSDVSAAGVSWTSASSYTDAWSDVTMIKVEVENEIASGQDLTITVNYIYGGDSANYASCAGNLNTWCSMGTYTYTLGKIVNASLQKTDGKTALLTYEDSANTAVTAKKSDTSSAHTESADVDIGVASGFSNLQNLSIVSVTPSSSVTLTDISKIIESAKTMSSSEANTTFGLTLALNDSTTKVLDLSKVDSNDSSTTYLGDTKNSEQNTLTLTLYNGDALTETTPLTVAVVLTGTATDVYTNAVKDITFTINLTINREKAGVTAETAIDAGKLYSIFTGSSDNSVTINQDSAFTTQFSLNYVPNQYAQSKTVSFGNALPAGTTLLLIDVPVTSEFKEDSANPWTYYTYTATGSESDNSVSLTEFQKIGSSDQYEIPVGDKQVYETLLLIVDFSGCTNKPAAGTTYTISLTQTGTEGTVISPDSGSMTCRITGSGDNDATRSFALSGGEDTASYNTAYRFTYSSTVTGASDAYYVGKTLALVVNEKVADGGSSTLPDDAYLVVNDQSYYRNTEGKFIIPLEKLSVSNISDVTAEVTLCSAAPQDTTLTFTLWVSATDDGGTPLLGDSTGESVDVAYTVASEPSFNVTGMSTRLVTSLSDALTVSYEYQDFSGYSVTLELQKKDSDSGTYATSTTDLMSVTVNGVTKTPSSGVVDLMSSSAVQAGSGTASLSLNQSLSGTATYRLLFKVCDSSGAVVYEIPYNFIVSL
ncbi:MAG: hypothetical protein LUC83_01880 [Clostridiales bacterium]|nr:hypothetical protein [Clostridiales bacterium]